MPPTSPATCEAPCHHCGKLDDQAHIMLECDHPLLKPIRAQAKRQQQEVALTLRTTYPNSLDKFFIEQLVHASWVCNSPNTARIWTGMWTSAILTEFFPRMHKMELAMTTPDRYKYRIITKRLLAPLIVAYKQMIRINISTFLKTPKHPLNMPTQTAQQ